MEADPAEAQNGVAGDVGLRQVDVPGGEGGLERVDALLRVVGHHREVGGGRRRRGGDLERGAGVGGKEPGGEDGAAAAAVEVAAAGGAHAAEELRGEVEAAGLGLGLDREGRDGVVVARFERLGRFREETGEGAVEMEEDEESEEEFVHWGVCGGGGEEEEEEEIERDGIFFFLVIIFLGKWSLNGNGDYSQKGGDGRR